MDKETIIEVLKRWNIWEKKIDAGIRRESYIKKISAYMERKEVIVLKGIRRSGKSTIVKQLIHELVKKNVKKKQTLYLNLEDYNFANDLNINLFEQVLGAYKGYSKNRGKIYFFIDEVQKIKGWEKWIRTKYELQENIKFIVTGSSASLLSRELSTLLTGRNVSFKIMPLSFVEFLSFCKKGSLEEYMHFGGFPEVVLEEDEERKIVLLQQHFEDILHKDIIDRYSIRNAKQLIEIARYLVSTSGSKVSVNKLSRVFGVSQDTISAYIGHMIDAYLLYEVAFFSYSAKIKHDIAKLPKVYAMDNGLMNVVSVKYSKNQGQMFENTVLIKLLEKYDEVDYWSNAKSEVDFVVSRQAINVTASDNINKRETEGLKDFLEKHIQFSTVLITPSLKKENAIPIIDFLKM